MRRARSIAAAVVGAVAAACSPPYPDCYPGSARDPGPACTTARISGVVIDGDPADWQDPAVVSVPPRFVPAEAPGDVLSYQVALEEDGLAFFLHTDGPPLTGDVGRYDVMLDDMRRESVVQGTWAGVAMQDTEHVWWMQYAMISGLDLEYAFGAAGIELRLPHRLLPFDGSALVDVRTQRAVDGQFLVPIPFTAGGPVCWDPARHLDCN